LNRFYCSLLILWLLSTPSWGQTCCSGGVPLSGNLGLPSSSTNTWQFAINYDLNVLRTLKFGTEKLDERNRQRITQAALIELGYTVSPKWSFDLFLSYVRQQRKIQNPGLPDQVQTTNGIGDAVVLIKYNLINKNGNVLTIGAGPKVPLGTSDRTNQGILLGADLQPGSGAWDGVVWTYFTHQLRSRKSMSYTLTATYRYTGTNEDFRAGQSYRFGSEFQGILGIGDRVTVGGLIVDPSLSFRYRRAFEDEVGGTELPNTGGEWVFINPVLGFSITQNLAFNIGLELPLFADITGTQLTPTYRFNTGLYFILNGKKSNQYEIKPLNYGFILFTCSW